MNIKKDILLKIENVFLYNHHCFNFWVEIIPRPSRHCRYHAYKDKANGRSLSAS